jgi:hypothetical protein
MGTSHSWAELDAKLNALARDVADMPKGQVGRAALATKKSVQAFMPDRLRGVGKRGAKLTVRYTEAGSGDSSSALVFVTGPAQLIENDTRAHRIPKDRARGRRRVIVIPGIGVRAFANHPGTKGKHPWAKGVTAAQPLISREFDAAGALLLRRHF